jgi:hypothetical protein
VSVIAGINSKPVEIAKIPNENHVVIVTPYFLAKKYDTGDDKRGRKVAAKRKYEDSTIL